MQRPVPIRYQAFGRSRLAGRPGEGSRARGASHRVAGYGCHHRPLAGIPRVPWTLPL